MAEANTLFFELIQLAVGTCDRLSGVPMTDVEYAV